MKFVINDRITIILKETCTRQLLARSCTPGNSRTTRSMLILSSIMSVCLRRPSFINNMCSMMIFETGNLSWEISEIIWPFKDEATMQNLLREF